MPNHTSNKGDAELAKILNGLHQDGDSDTACPYLYDDNKPCTCGVSTALAQLQQQRTQWENAALIAETKATISFVENIGDATVQAVLLPYWKGRLVQLKAALTPATGETDDE